MDRIIYKQKINYNITSPKILTQTNIPANAEILTAQMQRASMVVWYVKPIIPSNKTKTILVVWTGTNFDIAGMAGYKYIATIQCDDLIYHVLDLT